MFSLNKVSLNTYYVIDALVDTKGTKEEVNIFSRKTEMQSDKGTHGSIDRYSER